MNNYNSKNSFLNCKNIIILALIWIHFFIFTVILFYNNNNQLYDILQNIISLFASLSAITGIVYSNYRSDIRNEKSLKNSNNQLIEQLSRDKKENALNDVLIKSMKIINADLYQSKIPRTFIPKTFVEYCKKDKTDPDPENIINQHVQNKLYSYFDDIMYNPSIFNYLPFEIQDEIKNFVEEYNNFYRLFITFIQLSKDNNKKYRQFEYKFINSTNRDDYSKSDNYLIKESVQGELKDIEPPEDYKFFGNDKTVVIKITDGEYKHLKHIIQKIMYLSYKESLKYGYRKFD